MIWLGPGSQLSLEPSLDRMKEIKTYRAVDFFDGSSISFANSLGLGC